MTELLLRMQRVVNSDLGPKSGCLDRVSVAYFPSRLKQVL